MYPISNAVKALFEAEQRQVLRITGTDKNGTAINITDADVVIDSFNIDRFSCIGNKLEIGTATSAQMTVKLDNYDGRFNGIVFEGTELLVEIGIADWTQSNPTVNWIPCGYFTPDEQPRSLKIITIHALDRMMRFDATMPTLTPWVTQSGDVMTDSQGNIIYFVSNVQFPVTVQNLVKRVALLCGVPFTQSLSNLPNYSYTLSALPTLQQEITFRNIIQWCAGIMGANAWIDWTGSLRFSWYDATTGYTSTTANRFSSDLHEDDITITGVQYTNTQNVTIVSGSADYAIDMTGNYLAAVGISTILPNIRSRISGFTYRPFTATVINAPYLWPMDIITFVKDGVNHICAVTNVNFGINGTTALEGKGETAQTNSGTAPSGTTIEQGRLIEGAVEATQQLDESLNQEGIFNRLTNNGEAQGIYMDASGNLYINGTYIQSGVINANLLRAGMISDDSGENYWRLAGANSEFVTNKGIIGNFTISNGDLLWGSRAVGGTGAYIGKDGISYNTTLTDDPDTPQNLVKTEVFAQGIKMYWNNILRTIVEVGRSTGTGGFHVGTYDTQGNEHWPFQIWDDVTRVIYLRFFARCLDDFYVNGNVVFLQNLRVDGNLTVKGTKNRVVGTEQYSDRLLYAYETPAPMFGDVGEGVISEDGKCYVWLDPIFAQTISTYQYQVFLQKYGDGDAWVRERKGGYFIVQGTPGLSFGWEIKGKQKDYDQHRLDIYRQEERKEKTDYADLAAQYIERIKQGRIPE